VSCTGAAAQIQTWRACDARRGGPWTGRWRHEVDKKTRAERAIGTTSGRRSHEVLTLSRFAVCGKTLSVRLICT
jgi:hypothetical protein